MSTGSLSDYSEPTLLESGVWLYQITGQEEFLANSRILANLIEEDHICGNSGIVMNTHPITKTLNVNEDLILTKKFSCDVARLALLDSNYAQLTKTLADAFIEHED